VYATDNKVTVLTGDQDILQLVQDNVRVAIMRKGQGNYEVFNAENFYEKKNIYPKQMIDLKGLMGDTSDNYPGVKGIGEKTALKLLKEYETIDGLLENLDELPKGIRNKVNMNIDMLHLSRNLAEIKCDVPVTCELNTAVWQFDKAKVEDKFNELEFKNLSKLL